MFDIELDAISRDFSYSEYEVFHSKVYMQQLDREYIPPVSVKTYYFLNEAFNSQLEHNLNKDK